MTWGLGLRLAQRLGAGTRASLSNSALKRKKRKLELRLDPSRAALAAGPVEEELAILANWLELEPRIKVTELNSAREE